MEVNKCIKIASTTDALQYVITKVEITKLIDKGWRIVSMVNVEKRDEIWVYMEKPDNSNPKPDNSNPKKIKL